MNPARRTRQENRQEQKAKESRRSFIPGWILLLFLVVASSVCAQQPSQTLSISKIDPREIRFPLPPSNYLELLRMSPEELSMVDMARMNLLFAANLPGSEDLDIEAGLKTIDELALYVKKRTEELRPKFVASPEKFRNSEAYFKMTVLVTVLQKEKGLWYDPKFAIRPGEGYDEAVKSEMATSSRHLFINGLLSNEKRGTCSSMPVLWTAIGRRLGYPLYLVHAKSHLFCRWEDKKDRFNIEAAQGLMASPPDEEYKTWPFPLTDEEIAKGPYLKNLTPTEELADAMNTRFWELMTYHRYQEALGIALKVHQMLPEAAKYRGMINAATPSLPEPMTPGTPADPSLGIPNPVVDVQATMLPNLPKPPGVPGVIDPLSKLPPYVRAAMSGSTPKSDIPGIPAVAVDFLPPSVRSAMKIGIPDPLADIPPEARQLIPQR